MDDGHLPAWAGPFRQALAFLTPVGGAVEPGPMALFWFPAVGAAVGLAVGGAWWLAAQIWPPAVAAAVAVVADLVATGALHVDGVADCADGLLPPLSREQRLAAMADPRIGAFGAVAVVVVLLGRWVVLASLSPSLLLVAALWTASRTWMAASAVGVPYARAEGGLATAFRGDGSQRVLVPVSAAGLAAAVLLAVVWRPVAGPAAIAAATVGACGVVALGWRRVGGFTGDVLGAAGVIGETLGLLVACAKW
jgi:adenosylcobinamide-GDP ribazoletransferase